MSNFNHINYALKTDNKNEQEQTNHIGTTIYVEPDSEIGQLMESMNNREEQTYVNQANELLKQGTSKAKIISGLNNFMNLWGNPPTRDFKVLKKYILELEENKDIQ